ncbi:hypothetical protein QBC33DRAFT_573372 [Phialemonium atrogriseum]|uniref:Uncharacterized protein n=1 Tax=Phialemonium atrogriseum TaxID=1093897 RepID=A0AAJ0FDP3_9PEZI|nr:uncharacterized protein QBC33DRAFT_573372 [Phialemonium atrogriseum]KAK1763467.1 hypothetical protein QBC33DRAFT_573372 [Phialemonium atrogriseum]
MPSQQVRPLEGCSTNSMQPPATPLLPALQPSSSPSLRTLPLEIGVSIHCKIDTPRDLFEAIRSSPTLLCAFNTSRHSILSSVIVNAFGDSLHDAPGLLYVLRLVERDAHPTDPSAELGESIRPLDFVEGHLNEAFDYKMPGCLRAILQLYSIHHNIGAFTSAFVAYVNDMSNDYIAGLAERSENEFVWQYSPRPRVTTSWLTRTFLLYKIFHMVDEEFNCAEVTRWPQPTCPSPEDNVPDMEDWQQALVRQLQSSREEGLHLFNFRHGTYEIVLESFLGHCDGDCWALALRLD